MRTMVRETHPTNFLRAHRLILAAFAMPLIIKLLKRMATPLYVSAHFARMNTDYYSFPPCSHHPRMTHHKPIIYVTPGAGHYQS